MKAILEFTLPEESDDHRTALEGNKYLSLLQDFDNWLRSEIKYNNAGKEMQAARDNLHALALEHEVSIWR